MVMVEIFGLILFAVIYISIQILMFIKNEQKYLKQLMDLQLSIKEFKSAVDCLLSKEDAEKIKRTLDNYIENNTK